LVRRAPLPQITRATHPPPTPPPGPPCPAPTAAKGAYLNVLINLSGLPDGAERKTLREKAEGILAEAEKGSKAALRAALKKL
jgi:hypothetical protein